MTKLVYSTKLDVDVTEKGCNCKCCKDFKKSCKLKETEPLGTVIVHRYSPCCCRQCTDKIVT